MTENIKEKNVIEDLPITSIDLDMTNNCILGCDYCFRGEKNKRSLSWEVGTKAIDFLIEHSQDTKSLSVALFGGEPLMEFELIKKLVPYGKRKAAYYGKKIHFGATTNIVLVDDEKIEFFRQNEMTFHTSIDGGPESHDRHRHFPDGRGTSAIIEPKVRKILKYWPNTTARMTVSNDTVQNWFKDVLYLVDLGYKNLAMIPIPELDWPEDRLEIMKSELRKISDWYIERYRSENPIYVKHIEDSLRSIIKPSRRKHHCGAGRGSVLVKTDGTLYPCHRFGGIIDADSANQWQIGSIFEGIDHEKRKKLLNFDCISQTKADCENCLAVHACGISCIAVNWSCFGDIFKPHPNQCKFSNMFFVEAMRVHYILESEKNPLFMKKFYSQDQRNQNQNRNRNQSSGGNQPQQRQIQDRGQKSCNIQQQINVQNPKTTVCERCKPESEQANPSYQRGRFKES